MFRMHWPGRALLIASVAALLIPGLASAQDRDAQEVASYTLTEAGLAKYTQAAKQLAAIESGNPGECEEESDSTSLDAMAAKLNSVPAVKAAIQSAGMTTREYVVFIMSVFHNGMAAWALSQPGGKLPAGTSKANVDFYNRHASEFERLGALQKEDECGEQTDDEEYVE